MTSIPVPDGAVVINYHHARSDLDSGAHFFFTAGKTYHKCERRIGDCPASSHITIIWYAD